MTLVTVSLLGDLHGDIVGISGHIFETSPPSSVANGVFESANIAIFKEGTKEVQFTFPVDVLGDNLDPSDLSSGGLYIVNSIDDIDRNVGHIQAGALVSTYYVHFDTRDDNNTSLRAGTVTFERPIKAVVLVNNRGGYFNLAATDAVFGHPNTIYPGRGVHAHDFDLKTRNGNFENGGDGSNFDRIIISQDRKTITFECRNRGRIDAMRIFLDAPTLTSSVSVGSIREDAGQNAAHFTVTRNTVCVDQPVLVHLQSSDTSEVVVPATVTIPANQNSVTVPVHAVDDFVDDGNQTVTISATAEGYVATSSSIVVTSVNHAPTIAPVPGQSVNACDVFTIQLTATDPDGDNLTFEPLDVPAGTTVDPVTGVVQWTAPAMTSVGSEDFTIAVVDDGTPELDDFVTFPLTINPSVFEEFPVEGFVTTKGRFIQGDVLDLMESDNSDVTLRNNPRAVFSVNELEFEGHTTIVNPCVFEVTVEASVFARSPVVQKLMLYDYVTQQFVEVDVTVASQINDSVVTTVLDGDLSRFVSSAGELRGRLQFRSSVNKQNFSSNIDRIHWSIGE